MKKIFSVFLILSFVFFFESCTNDDSLDRKDDSLELEQIMPKISFPQKEIDLLKKIPVKGTSIDLNPTITKVTTLNGSTSIVTLEGADIPDDALLFTPQRKGIAVTLKDGVVTIQVSENSSASRLTSITVSYKEGGDPAILDISQEGLFTIEWVDIPAGSFIMGSPDTEKERQVREGPQHKVTLSAFKMSKYPITFEQFDAFCDATGHKKPRDNRWGRGKLPVIDVSWEDAVAFAQWVGDGASLPTEAQWEYACRAGSTTPFFFGDDANMIDDYAWYEDNSENRTHPVGEKKPNAFGLYDMHGNVWEWCNDWYDLDYEGRILGGYDKSYYARSPEHDPQGPESGEERVTRGGSLYRDPGACRAAIRFYQYPGESFSDVGFRLVLPIK